MAANLVHHTHGKSRVRLGRTWREGDVHHFVEWMGEVIIESDMEHAFVKGTNDGMTTTDTTKNTVYYVAKQMSKRCSPEEYCVALAKHFCTTYPLVSACEVRLEEKPWSRVEVAGKPHNHGYTMQGPCMRLAQAVVHKDGPVVVTSGMKGLQVLKTTQSGYEGYLVDQYTMLKPTKERILATSMDVWWSHVGTPGCYNKAYGDVQRAVVGEFFGPPDKGVYSPSVQNTLYLIGQAVLKQVSSVKQVTFTAPNIHFIPMNNPQIGVPFADDVYIATSEPHGNISCTVSRDRGFQAMSKL